MDTLFLGELTLRSPQHALPVSIAAFQRANSIAGRDGAPSRCTVILSEENIFAKANQGLASEPSLRNMRNLINEILLESAAGLKAGDTCYINTTSQIIRYDIEFDAFDELLEFLKQENILESRGAVARMVRFSKPLPPMFYPQDDVGLLQGEVDIFHVLKHLGYGPFNRERPFRFDDHLASGVLEPVQDVHSSTSIREIKLLRDPLLSQTEMDNLMTRLGDKYRATNQGRVMQRRQFLDIFTKNRCFVAGLVQFLGVQHQMPAGWRTCGHCLYCMTHKPASRGSTARPVRPVDPQRLEAVARAVPKRYASDPRFLTRVALGVISARVRKFELDQYAAVFGSMRRNSFEVRHCNFPACILFPSFSLTHCESIGAGGGGAADWLSMLLLFELSRYSLLLLKLTIYIFCLFV